MTQTETAPLVTTGPLPETASIAEKNWQGQSTLNWVPFERLMALIGIKPDDRVSVCHKPPGGMFMATLGSASDAKARAGVAATKSDVWFGVNPISPAAALVPGQRGEAEHVGRVTALYADLDVKDGGLASLEVCEAVVAGVSAVLGGRQPVAVVSTGHGLHPYWALEGGEDVPRAARQLRRFGVLVATVAAEQGGAVDSVYGIDRMLRVPGTRNRKDPANPIPIRVTFYDDDDPDVEPDTITLDDLDDLLTEAGIRDDGGDDDHGTGEVVPCRTWPVGETCSFAAAMLKGLPTDGPRKGGGANPSRHHWALNKAVRLYAARRRGCLSDDDLTVGLELVRVRLLALLATGEKRAIAPREWAGIVVWARQRVESFTPERLSSEVAHDHKTDTAAVDKPAVALRVIRADQVQLSRVRYLWVGRVPLGAVTLMPGEEGIGKTTLGVRIISDTTRGTLPGEYGGVPRDVVVLSLEDGLADVYGPRLQEAGADMTRVHIVRAAIDAKGDDVSVIIPRDLGQVGRLVRNVDAALVWVDSLVTTLPDELKSISYKDTAKVLKALGEWAEAERIAVMAPWHLNKGSGSSSALRIMDSRAFRTAVRSMLMVVKDPDAPEGVSQGLVVLDKANGGSLNVPGLRYRIRSAFYAVEEVDEATGEVNDIASSCGVADWIGEVSAGVAQELVQTALGAGLAKENDPATWLKELLTDKGATPRQDVMDAARLAGFSESGMKRAARRLGLLSTEKTGQNSKGAPFRIAVWDLPASSRVTPALTHPTGPTGPTGESSSDPIEPITPSGSQSGQSGQSDPGSESDPTG